MPLCCNFGSPIARKQFRAACSHMSMTAGNRHKLTSAWGALKVPYQSAVQQPHACTPGVTVLRLPFHINHQKYGQAGTTRCWHVTSSPRLQTADILELWQAAQGHHPGVTGAQRSSVQHCPTCHAGSRAYARVLSHRHGLGASKRRPAAFEVEDAAGMLPSRSISSSSLQRALGKNADVSLI